MEITMSADDTVAGEKGLRNIFDSMNNPVSIPGEDLRKSAADKLYSARILKASAKSHRQAGKNLMEKWRRANNDLTYLTRYAIPNDLERGIPVDQESLAWAGEAVQTARDSAKSQLRFASTAFHEARALQWSACKDNLFASLKTLKFKVFGP
jgi:hypothetical protein